MKRYIKALYKRGVFVLKLIIARTKKLIYFIKNEKRLCIYYNIIEEPWGGGNSFLKAFRNYIINNKSYKLVKNEKDYYDIILVNGCSKNQNEYLNVNDILYLQRINNCRIIYRLDGARFRYNNMKSITDDIQFNVLNISDYIIFQSKECLITFQDIGYNKKNYTIISNGVNQEIFNANGKRFWNGKDKLKILSVNWSSNKRKGYDTIAKFSEMDNVEMTFVGNWNEETDKKNVKVYPPLRQEELATFYKSSNIFLHAAMDDPCPNVVLEAMSCGLPIIYHNSGGTPEIASNYGIALPDIIDKNSIISIINEIKNRYSELKENLIKDNMNFSIDTIAEKYLDVFNKVLRNEY